MHLGNWKILACGSSFKFLCALKCRRILTWEVRRSAEKYLYNTSHHCELKHTLIYCNRGIQAHNTLQHRRRAPVTRLLIWHAR